MLDTRRILPEVGKRAFFAENNWARTAERDHAYAACNHTQDDDVEENMHPRAKRSCQYDDPAMGFGFRSKRHPQTSREMIKASTAMASGRWNLRIAAFATGSSVLAARNPETSRIIISRALTQWIDTIIVP
jgi:hypothetical protein